MWPHMTSKGQVEMAHILESFFYVRGILWGHTLQEGHPAIDKFS
jgi:hypothetical protein